MIQFTKNSKNSILTLLILILFSGVFMSASRPNVKKIKGTIHSYGNMPFNYPGIVTEKGFEYAVFGDKELKDNLLKNQGCLIEFEGVIIPKEKEPVNSLKDGSFEVINWKVIK